MAYVQIPKDLNKIKEKKLFNLTKRQLIFFPIGIIIGMATFLLTKNVLGRYAIFLLVFTGFPFFYMGIDTRDGIPFEKRVSYMLEQKFTKPKIRIYKTENFYKYIAEGSEVKVVEKNKQTTKKTTRKVAKKSNGIRKTKKIA